MQKLCYIVFGIVIISQIIYIIAYVAMGIRLRDFRMERIVIAICTIWIAFALLNICSQSMLWDESLKKSGEYAVYINGREIDVSNFDMEALSVRDYEIQINDEKKKIYLNRKK